MATRQPPRARSVRKEHCTCIRPVDKYACRQPATDILAGCQTGLRQGGAMVQARSQRSRISRALRRTPARWPRTCAGLPPIALENQPVGAAQPIAVGREDDQQSSHPHHGRGSSSICSRRFRPILVPNALDPALVRVLGSLRTCRSARYPRPNRSAGDCCPEMSSDRRRSPSARTALRGKFIKGPQVGRGDLS